ncbi:DUF488 family protein [uncultured Sphingomonas sp.]|uniref:DUF488 family protein n=1 Tax=uncultured Sphingomonas sp. TaxID=158754 RepID=UPI0035CCA893
MRIITVGYESATLADIRAMSLSRRPSLSKNVLAGGSREAGIDHVERKTLGSPKTGRDTTRCGDHAMLDGGHAE